MKWEQATRGATRGLGLLALAFCASTCTDANGSLVVLQAQVPGDNCVVADEVGSAGRLESGTLDVALDQPYSYKLYPLLQNNLVPLGGTSGVEPNRMLVTGASVEILPPPGLAVPFTSDCASAFDHPSAASLGPGLTAAIRVEPLRSCHAAIIKSMFESGKLDPATADEIYFRVKIRAKAQHGGGELLSDPFEFPIRVCYGCLQTGFTGAYAVFDFPQIPACDHLTSNPFQGNACNPSQDSGPVLCCARDPKAQQIQCPAVPTPVTSTAPATNPGP